MNNVIQQLETLALQPDWDSAVSTEKSTLQHLLSETEQALLKTKIVCFVYIPEPEKPRQDDPEKQDESEQDDEDTQALKHAV